MYEIQYNFTSNLVLGQLSYKRQIKLEKHVKKELNIYYYKKKNRIKHPIASRLSERNQNAYRKSEKQLNITIMQKNIM